MPSSRAQRQLRAPAENGGLLHEPPATEWPVEFERNRIQLSVARVQLLGRSLEELAISARAELLGQARAYTCRYLSLPTNGEIGSSAKLPAIVMAGHQPQLYHPGVWYKNFALSRLARSVSAFGVNLVVDSDLCRSTEVAVPGGSPHNLELVRIPFDTSGREVPFEERGVQDESMFSQWGSQVAAALAPLVPNPLVEELWPQVVARQASERNLGRALAQGRHVIESQWLNTAGRQLTLEVPQSAVCRLWAFHWFVVHILANLASFVSTHNEVLAEYRRSHRLRSTGRPVPDLAIVGEWLETPFWVWSNENPMRRHLYACRSARDVILSDRQGLELRLAKVDERPERVVDQLSSIESGGIKIRTRALTTTLFSRLLLCDYFIHGIGGAKYDEVTDRIIEQFYELAPPRFGVATATLHLPLAAAPSPRLDEREIKWRLRELRFNPDRWIQANEVPASELPHFLKLRDTKRRWIETTKTPQNAKSRHEAIAEVNARLEPFARSQESALLAELEKSQHWQRVTSIRASREFAYCLFPAEVLQRRLLDS